MRYIFVATHRRIIFSQGVILKCKNTQQLCRQSLLHFCHFELTKSCVKMAARLSEIIAITLTTVADYFSNNSHNTRKIINVTRLQRRQGRKQKLKKKLCILFFGFNYYSARYARFANVHNRRRRNDEKKSAIVTLRID